MPIHNDPNINGPNSVQRRKDAEGWSTNSIVLGSLAALAVVSGIFYMMNNRNPTVATTRPAVTTNAPVTTPTTMPAQPRASETTGSGPTTVTPLPGAPSTAPATAR
jgi:hypothetical protein